VHTKDGIVKFKRNEDGLFIYKPSDEHLKDLRNETNFMVQTVDENKKGYNKRQFESAKQARKLYHIIGCGNVKFKRNVDGLYVYQPSKEYLSVVANENQVNGSVNATNLMVQTMNENKIGYSKREFEDAKVARKLYHNLGCPLLKTLRRYSGRILSRIVPSPSKMWGLQKRFSDLILDP
jgi:hypothetical protein